MWQAGWSREPREWSEAGGEIANEFEWFSLKGLSNVYLCLVINGRNDLQNSNQPHTSHIKPSTERTVLPFHRTMTYKYNTLQLT